MVAYWVLRNPEEDMFRHVSERFTGPRDFKVTERVDRFGTRYWREIIPPGKLTDEEERMENSEWVDDEHRYFRARRKSERLVAQQEDKAKRNGGEDL
ncbi:hypothetical protein CBER1_09332 [Cercospora berteroae]|uniref:Uncharacterized protein n=1 Tax=Cercospora berteroae TaxID=357750 RepID=A0A2S6CNF5_9PEZI|nr:hypothetical protein CBER1_09332 [Cercospora berteroae]